jgi:hypothetical protein
LFDVAIDGSCAVAIGCPFHPPGSVSATVAAFGAVIRDAYGNAPLE